MLIFLSEIDNFVLIISFSFIGWICLKSADQVRSNFDVCFLNRFTFLWFLLSTKERGGFIISGGFFFEPNRDCRLPHDSIVKILSIYIMKIFAPKIYILSIFFVRAILRERWPFYSITQTYSFGKFGKFNGLGDFDRFSSFTQRLSVLLTRDNVAMLGSHSHPPALPPAIDWSGQQVVVTAWIFISFSILKHVLGI